MTHPPLHRTSTSCTTPVKGIDPTHTAKGPGEGEREGGSFNRGPGKWHARWTHASALTYRIAFFAADGRHGSSLRGYIPRAFALFQWKLEKTPLGESSMALQWGRGPNRGYGRGVCCGVPIGKGLKVSMRRGCLFRCSCPLPRFRDLIYGVHFHDSFPTPAFVFLSLSCPCDTKSLIFNLLIPSTVPHTTPRSFPEYPFFLLFFGLHPYLFPLALCFGSLDSPEFLSLFLFLVIPPSVPRLSTFPSLQSHPYSPFP